MARFKEFITQHPIQFSILLTLLLFFLYVLAAVLAGSLSSNTLEFNLLEALGRLASAIFLAFLTFRLGWAYASGLTSLGSPAAWVIALGILIYEVVTHVYPFMDGTDLESMNIMETAAVVLNALTTGPLEEITFRGLIFYAFIRLWAATRAGILKCALLSALLFGASHLIHLALGRPLPQATLVAANAFLAGIYYAALVFRWTTLWPAIAIHSLLNAAAAIIAFNTPGFEEQVSTLLLSTALQIPVVVFGLYLLWRSSPQQTLPAVP